MHAMLLRHSLIIYASSPGFVGCAYHVRSYAGISLKFILEFCDK